SGSEEKNDGPESAAEAIPPEKPAPAGNSAATTTTATKSGRPRSRTDGITISSGGSSTLTNKSNYWRFGNICIQAGWSDSRNGLRRSAAGQKRPSGLMAETCQGADGRLGRYRRSRPARRRCEGDRWAGRKRNESQRLTLLLDGRILIFHKALLRRWTPPGRSLGRPIRLFGQADGSYLKEEPCVDGRKASPGCGKDD